MKRQTFTRIIAIVAASVLGCTLTSVDVSAQDGPEVFASGFNGPMGVMVASDGSIWVVDSGVGGEEEMMYPDFTTYELKAVKFGHTSRIIRIDEDGNQMEVGILPSIDAGGGEIVGGARLAAVDGTVMVSTGPWVALESDRVPLMSSIASVSDDGVKELVDTFEIEVESNPDGRFVESNPFGMTATPDGKLLVADAAANTLLRVDPSSGDVEVVALFDDLTSPIPNPHHDNKMETDAVPTAVVLDDGGNAYVSFLSGFPFVPGSAKVVKVDPKGKVSDYATGLTMLVDLQRGPDGNMYAVSFGRFTEQGPDPASGAVLRVSQGDGSTEVVTGLPFPTSIAFNEAGDAFVTTNGLGAPGSGQLLRYEGLAKAGSGE
ncbi:MAG: ScyD/ScyE family protein [Rhodothermia bacterium]|nr:ScyD/ScyE family protein [Rhodothermia bacterium]